MSSRIKLTSDIIYKHIYIYLVLAIFVVTIITSFGLSTEITLYSNYTLVEKESVTRFMNTIPSQFKDGVLYFEFKADCGDMYSYFRINPIPTICITMDVEDMSFFWKAAIYHEIGHYVWWSKLTYDEQEEYKRIYDVNYNSGKLTSQYSEKNFREGFAEDFMYFHMNVYYMGPQENNTQEYMEKTINRILMETF